MAASSLRTLKVQGDPADVLSAPLFCMEPDGVGPGSVLATTSNDNAVISGNKARNCTAISSISTISRLAQRDCRSCRHSRDKCARVAREYDGTRQGQSLGIDLKNHTTAATPTSTAVA